MHIRLRIITEIGIFGERSLDALERSSLSTSLFPIPRVIPWKAIPMWSKDFPDTFLPFSSRNLGFLVRQFCCPNLSRLSTFDFHRRDKTSDRHLYWTHTSRTVSRAKAAGQAARIRSSKLAAKLIKSNDRVIRKYLSPMIVSRRWWRSAQVSSLHSKLLGSTEF